MTLGLYRPLTKQGEKVVEKTQGVYLERAGIKFRKAEEKDVPVISELTLEKNLLPRSSEEVRSLLSHYHLAVDAETEEIAGCISTKIYDADAEIISFRVKEKFLGLGIGKELLERQLDLLNNQGEISRIFALSTEEVATRIFLKAGFVKVGIQLFGPKVISDCIRCPKNRFSNVDGKYLCDEIAMIYRPT